MRATAPAGAATGIALRPPLYPFVPARAVPGPRIFPRASSFSPASPCGGAIAAAQCAGLYARVRGPACGTKGPYAAAPPLDYDLQPAPEDPRRNDENQNRDRRPRHQLRSTARLHAAHARSREGMGRPGAARAEETGRGLREAERDLQAIPAGDADAT